ncbi:MAG: ABC transporter permease [Methanospirillum sp.]|nr:ABC transporter permease [Methanospirillum sp.]
MNSILVYCRRDLIRWYRAKWGFIAAMTIPAAWLIFVGLALPIRFTDNYLDFVTPGILAMTTLNASLGGGSLIILDRTLGFFNKFLALPSPRESILFGKILVIMIRGLIQNTIILTLAFILGAKLFSPLQLAGTYLILVIFGTLLSAFATTLALYVDEHDSYTALYAMVSMPLFFTSSAMMPYSAMPTWLLVPAALNPLSFAIDSIRLMQTGVFPGMQILLLSGLALLVGVISVRVFRKVEV